MAFALFQTFGSQEIRGALLGWLLVSLIIPTLEAEVRITRAPYRGWAQCVWMDNGKAEVVIVPQVGRVMQFRRKGEEGPFWEQTALSGKDPKPESKEWLNFGGDKTWPAPQSDWPKWTPRGWPPPVAFDSMPATVEVRGGDTVVLTTSVDPHYGIRAVRRIRLDSRETVMRVTTRYEKVTGVPMEVGVWVITQLGEPEVVMVPVKGGTLFKEGYNLQSERVPPSLRREREWLKLGRDRRDAYKIGSDSDQLIWLGEGGGLRITAEKRAGGRFPDGGSSVEVYTNPDPLAYVELEVLGPLKRLEAGDSMEHGMTYRLFRKRGADGLDEIRGVRE